MRNTAFCLLLAFILLQILGGIRSRTDDLVVLIGTALPIQLIIYAFLRLRVLRVIREAISSVFASLPLALGFSLLVVVGMAAIVAEVFLLRDFVRPSDSWGMITLGFLLGIMDPVFHSLGRTRNKREPAVAPEGSLASTLKSTSPFEVRWIKTCPRKCLDSSTASGSCASS